MEKNQPKRLTKAQSKIEPGKSSGLSPGKKHIYKPIPQLKGCNNC